MQSFSIRYFDEWRDEARRLLGAGIAPERIEWHDAWDPQSCLEFGNEATESCGCDIGGGDQPDRIFQVPRAFVRLSQASACHRDRRRWDVLYRILWRLSIPFLQFGCLFEWPGFIIGL